MSPRSIRNCGLSILLLSTSIEGGARAETFELGFARGAGAPQAFTLFPAEVAEQRSHAAIDSGTSVRAVLRKTTLFEVGRVPLETDDDQLADLPAKLRDDLRALVLAPTEWRGREWGRFGLGLGLVLASSALDEPVHSALDRRHSSDLDRLADGIRPLGQEAGIALFAGAWAVGKATHRPKWVALGQDGLEASLIASGLLVPALKSMAGRPRPRDSHSIEEQFDFFSGEQSFPSGEAAQAFALASVLASHSDSRWVQGAAYGVAGLLAVNRIALDAHWTSDVVAGALIGTAIGRWVVRRRGDSLDSDRTGPIKNWAIGPATGPTGSGYGLAVRLTF